MACKRRFRQGQRRRGDGHSGKVLNVAGASTVNGGNIDQ
jgi:hypothetical protein